MEEILASIRRIIADDQSLPVRGTFAAAGTPATASPVKSIAPAPAPVVMLRAAPPVMAIAPRDPSDDRSRQMADDGHALHEPDLHEQGLHEQGLHAHDLHEQDLHTPDLREAHANDMHEHGSISAPQYPSPDGTGADGHAHPGTYEDDETVDETPAISDAEPPALGGGRTLFSPSTDQAVSAAFNTLAATRLADNSEDLLDLARNMIRPLLKGWLDDNLPSMVERMVRAEIERVARGGR